MYSVAAAWVAWDPWDLWSSSHSCLAHHSPLPRRSFQSHVRADVLWSARSRVDPHPSLYLPPPSCFRPLSHPQEN